MLPEISDMECRCHSCPHYVLRIRIITCNSVVVKGSKVGYGGMFCGVELMRILINRAEFVCKVLSCVCMFTVLVCGKRLFLWFRIVVNRFV